MMIQQKYLFLSLMPLFSFINIVINETYNSLCFRSFDMFSGISQQKILHPSGEIWPDTEGNHINAHGGGLLFTMEPITGSVRADFPVPKKTEPNMESAAIHQRIF